ncbi:unnamed protein product [Phytophthora lilii]|uniref:Unnamed protein product n=1 Tax=Phytophthora lilii TaxID=2077276 RepID=A0A9W6WT99_9STRA|nr:unnamed protein product [Phytophthora lilii]
MAGWPPQGEVGSGIFLLLKTTTFYFFPQVVGAEYALFWLSRENPIRCWCIRVTLNAYFDRFILACIVVNSIVLAAVDFSVVDDKLNPVSYGKTFKDGKVVEAYSLANHVVEVLEQHVFTATFSAECMLKVVALGFSGDGSYLRDPWNTLDFTLLSTR